MTYLIRDGHMKGVYMIEISEKEEQKLDKREIFGVHRGDRLFSLGPANVKYYGEIDFHNGTDDYKLLEESRLFYSLEFQGVSVPANYDYDKHCCYSNTRRAKWFDTVNAAIICQYGHGVLGKPKRIAIIVE